MVSFQFSSGDCDCDCYCYYRDRDRDQNQSWYQGQGQSVATYHYQVKSSQVRSLWARERKAISTWYMLVNPIELNRSEFGKKNFKSSQVISYHTIPYYTIPSQVRSGHVRQESAEPYRHGISWSSKSSWINVNWGKIILCHVMSCRTIPYHVKSSRENSIQ